MAESEISEKSATIRARNIGGITETELYLTPGVTVLTGRNATNRTSFLQAIMAVMGSNNVSLKGDADEGSVEIELGEETYQRTLRDTNGTIAFGGDPYLDEATVADLFAFLLESNETRRAVVRSEDLRELIMRPIDTEEIRATIDQLERERDSVDEQLEELEGLKKELPSLEQRKQQIESEIEEKREELANTEDEIVSMDADVDQSREEKRELESRLEDLGDLRTAIESVRSDIDLQEESLTSLRNERAKLQEELEELPETPMGEHATLDQEISRLRDRKQNLEVEVRDLQDVLQFNEDMLDGEETKVSDALVPDDDSFDNVTDQLVEDDEIICWTCGSEVERERIEETTETIRSICQDQISEISDVEDELEELRSEKREREKQQQRRESLERDISNVEEEIEQRESRLESFREQRDQLSGEIATVEKEVDALESENFSENLELHKEANQLEFELGQLESELDDVSDRISTIEERLAREDELKERRNRIQDDLEDQRTRIENIEREAVEQFNSHMKEILDILEYANLARIWIERVAKTVRDGRRTVEKSVFELHVVRKTESGATYEDTIDHLSESEREITGLTFALAGYLVHDVHETVPFMLLDSLEAIDAERLSEFISYLAGYAQYVVVALLPEDAQALPETYSRVTEI